MKHLLPLSAMLLMAANISSANAAKPTAEQKGRFMKICMEQKSNQVSCYCFTEANYAVVDQKEMEMSIAMLKKDKAKEKEIKSDPRFDFMRYAMKKTNIMMSTAQCIQNGGKYPG